MRGTIIPHLLVVTFFLLSPCIQLSTTTGMTVDEFLTITLDQKKILDKFSARVVDKVPHNYMKEESYLVRFLRETDFDLGAAEALILNMIKWRRDNSADELGNPDVLDQFELWIDDFDFRFQGCDKEGRPILSANLGDLDIRSIIVSGDHQKLQKLIDAVFENAVDSILKAQRHGQNITHADIILDLKGFAPASHICPLCVSIYIHTFQNMQYNYPGYINRFYIVNTPNYALPVWNTIRQFLNKKLTSVVKIYGVNKDVWSKALLEDIDRSQLSKRFGGTKPDALNAFDFVKSGKPLSCNLSENDIYY